MTWSPMNSTESSTRTCWPTGIGTSAGLEAAGISGTTKTVSHDESGERRLDVTRGILAYEEEKLQLVHHSDSFWNRFAFGIA
jgi:hypothetical protein